MLVVVGYGLAMGSCVCVCVCVCGGGNDESDDGIAFWSLILYRLFLLRCYLHVFSACFISIMCQCLFLFLCVLLCSNKNLSSYAIKHDNHGVR